MRRMVIGRRAAVPGRDVMNQHTVISQQPCDINLRLAGCAASLGRPRVPGPRRPDD